MKSDMHPRELRASLTAQIVKNLHAMQETQIQSLGWEDPWRREWLPTPVFLPGKFHGQRSLVSTVHGVTALDMTEQLTLSPGSSGVVKEKCVVLP